MYSPECKDPRRLAFTSVEISYGSGKIGPDATRFFDHHELVISFTHHVDSCAADASVRRSAETWRRSRKPPCRTNADGRLSIYQ
jgi:hypothetical protein